jgi:hypothetical protein
MSASGSTFYVLQHVLRMHTLQHTVLTHAQPSTLTITL